MLKLPQKDNKELNILEIEISWHLKKNIFMIFLFSVFKIFLAINLVIIY